jgi:hypothetical protein
MRLVGPSIAKQVLRLAALCVIFFAQPSHATPQSMFPSGSPWLGGSEWERRMSMELRAGSMIPEDGLSKSLAGVVARLHWGPWISLEGDYRAVSPLQKGSQSRGDLLVPLRFPWSSSEYLAPVFGYSFQNEAGLTVGGLQLRWRVWKLSLATQALIDLSSSEGAGLTRFSQQIEYVFEAGERLHSFLGLRFDREWLNSEKPRVGGDELASSTDLSLVSGVRF